MYKRKESVLGNELNNTSRESKKMLSLHQNRYS